MLPDWLNKSIDIDTDTDIVTCSYDKFVNLIASDYIMLHRIDLFCLLTNLPMQHRIDIRAYTLEQSPEKNNEFYRSTA